MTMEQFIEKWAGKDWETSIWNADEIGVYQYDKLTYFLIYNTGYVWIDQLDNTFTVETEDAVLSRFKLPIRNEYLGCALNVEFNGKYLLIGTHKFYPHPEAPENFAYRAQLSEVEYKTGLCNKFCTCLLTLVDILAWMDQDLRDCNLKIRVIL